jgi:hypothetical protein
MALTMNNLGCFYKKRNKPNVALNYLQAALQIEEHNKSEDYANMAGTKLNICAILS